MIIIDGIIQGKEIKSKMYGKTETADISVIDALNMGFTVCGDGTDYIFNQDEIKNIKLHLTLLDNVNKPEELVYNYLDDKKIFVERISIRTLRCKPGIVTDSDKIILTDKTGFRYMRRISIFSDNWYFEII